MKINQKNVVWLNEQQHVGTEDVEMLAGRSFGRKTASKKSKYRRVRGFSSYRRSLDADLRKMEREEQRKAERSALLDPTAMALAIVEKNK